MIKKIGIKNFKCFKSLELPVEKVNVLTGINGMGKSTIIQSILLMYQTFLKDESIQGLYLNEKYIELGNAEDVLYENAEVSAYRIRPQKFYHIINEDELADRNFGNNGEYALQYLSEYGDMEVHNNKVIIADKLGNSLNNQTRIWMDKIAPGIFPQINVNKHQRISELSYEFIEGKEKTASYKSINVGFGITYVLPLVVAILSAREGDLILMENSEAHIHPAGQRMLGELITLAGEGGVQIFIETHSDYVLNGMRLLVKKKKANQNNIRLNFFYKDTEDGFIHRYISPQIKEDGRLDIWPEGFFDEWDKASFELF